MIFENYYLECLSQASYLIADESTKHAAIIDPQRDIDIYLKDLEENNLKLKYIFETHIHADFSSGHQELAKETGAQIVFGSDAKGRLGFDSLFARDGNIFSLNDDGVHLGIIETPGHTPESITIALFTSKPKNFSADNYGAPEKIFTGDTMFIGDVGRPDLLGSVGLSSHEMADQLYDSLHNKLMQLPDQTQIFPGHGAGSACGKALSTERSDTLGSQRNINYALQKMTKKEFIDIVSEGQPLAPQYFSHSIEMNTSKHNLMDESTPCPLIGWDEVKLEMNKGTILLDTREPTDFTLGHIKGSINIGTDGRFAETAGQLFSPETKIILVGYPQNNQDAYVRLGRIGYDNCIGQLENFIQTLEMNPNLVKTSSRVDAIGLATLISKDDMELTLIDVRTPTETENGMIAGAMNIPLAQLHEKIKDLNPDSSTVIYCAGGWRSSVGASYLRANGFENVRDVIGGYDALKQSINND